jgi:outer membrane lipoprotein SlyB
MPKNASSIIVFVLLAAALSACRSHNSPPGGVIVDMKGVDPAQYQRDLNECTAYASQVDAAGKVGGNAAGGAVVGGAIGAIFGGADGAARGAGAGAVTGGARGVAQTVGERHQVVANCLRNRGYSVLN